MLFTDIAPMQKFITTDILGQPSFYKYTTGYIVHAAPATSPEKPFMHVTGVLTRVGKAGKSRIMLKEFYAAPIVFRDIIDSGFYNNATHLLTKFTYDNILKMTNFEFLAWAYAQMSAVKKLQIKIIWPEAFDPLMVKISRLATNLSTYSDKDIHNVVGSSVVRELFLERLRKIYSFLRHYISVKNKDFTETILKRHVAAFSQGIHKKVFDKVLNLLEVVKVNKHISKELLTENDNVSEEYENSGYWV